MVDFSHVYFQRKVSLLFHLLRDAKTSLEGKTLDFFKVEISHFKKKAANWIVPICFTMFKLSFTNIDDFSSSVANTTFRPPFIQFLFPIKVSNKFIDTFQLLSSRFLSKKCTYLQRKPVEMDRQVRPLCLYTLACRGKHERIEMIPQTGQVLERE